MLGTAVIEIFLLPILLSTAGQLSLVTVITNLLTLPVLPIVMGFGFAATLLGYAHAIVALPLVAVSNLMLEYILLITKFFASIPFGVVEFQIPKWAVAAMYIALAVWLYSLQKFQIQKEKMENSATKNPDLVIGAVSFGAALTPTNLERLDNFFQSHSSSDSQKKQ